MALGSPLLALSNHPHFPVVWLIEEETVPFNALKKRVDWYYPKRADLLKGDCNEVLPSVATNIASRTDRALFLLDPEGLEVRMSTIRKVRTRFSGAEFLILYPEFMAVARCIAHQPSFPKLDAFFGDDELEGGRHWSEIVEQTTGGDSDEEESGTGMEKPVHQALLNYYLQNLSQTGCSVTAVSPIIRSQGGLPLYRIIYAGKNKNAGKITTQIFESRHRDRSP